MDSTETELDTDNIDTEPTEDTGGPSLTEQLVSTSRLV